MKEIILHETLRQNGHIVLTALAGTTITVDNILGIINKTTGKVVYTPLKYGKISIGTLQLPDGTYQEIIFGQDIPLQPGNSQFLIKIYTDEEIVIPTDYAKEATLGASQDTSVSTTIFGWLKSIRDFLVGIVTTNPYAKDSTVAKEAAATANKETIMGGKDITPDAEGKFLVGMAFNPNYYSFYDDGQYFRIDYSSSDYVEGELGDILRKLPNPGHDNGYVIVGIKPGVDPTGADIQDIENCIRSDGGADLTEYFDLAECTPGLWKVKSVLEIDDYNLMLYVYEPVPVPRSVREVYEKMEEIDMTAAQNVANWLGITEATEYTALTPAEAIAIARDCQYNVMGTDWPIPTWLPTGVTEAQVESAAEGLGIPYHEPTQTA